MVCTTVDVKVNVKVKVKVNVKGVSLSRCAG